MNNYTVYEHLFPNGKRYIGITRVSTKERWEKNGNGYKTQTVFKAIQKYGWDNIEHNIVAENLSYEDACKMEVELIKKYKTMNKKYGYNNTSGGDVGHTVSELARQNMSKAQKGHKCSEKVKQINREKRLGKPRPISEVIKTAEKLRGRKFPMTEYRRQRIKEGIANMTPEKKKQWRENVNNALIGKRPKHHNGRKIAKRDLFTGEIISVYNSIANASMDSSIDRGSIIRACQAKNNINSACGFIWQYFDNDIKTVDDFDIDIVNQQDIDYTPLMNMITKQYKNINPFLRDAKISFYAFSRIKQRIGLSFKVMNKIAKFFNCKTSDLFYLPNSKFYKGR